VRKYLIQCLEAQADKESCASCQQQAAYILAVFIRIGFGCSQDTERSQRYLLQSLRPHSDLSEAIKNLKYGGRSIAEDSTEESDVMALDIPFADIDSEYLDSQNAAMVYKELHTELLALEKSLGQGHRTVIDMKKSVLRIQELRGYWDDVEILAQDLIAALSEAPNHSLQQMMLWDVQSTYAHCLSAKGQVQSAEELFLDLYSQAKSIFGPNHLVVLGHLRALCTFWMAMSEDAKVEEHLSDLGLFEPDRETPKPSNMHYANLAILLGSNYVDQGRYDDAERMIVPAVELIKGTHGDGHPQSLLVLVHLVILYIKTERLDVAEEVALHIQGSWEMFAYHNGAPAPSYPRSLNLLAQVYAAQDRLDEAIRTIQKATTIHYRFFAFEKLAELDYLDSEACFLLKLERWDEGVHQQRKVTELSQEILGYRHQDSRDRVVGLAAAYLLSDNLALAERVLMALLRDLEEDPTASKSNLMACTEHLAELRQRQARFEEAIHFAEIALGCASELRGKRDVKPTNFMRKIAELYNEDKSYSKALAIRIQILDLIETESSENSEQVVDAMEDVADVYFHLRDFTNAELYYRKALKACQTGLGTKHEMYIRLLGSLASTIEEDPNRVDEVTEIEEEIDALEDDMDDIVSELA
jgi:tetratricopeptide (TPR) repeat protein